MRGLMMDQPLLISGIIDHAARYHGDTEVVSVENDGSRHRTNYADVRRRALKLGSALLKRGMSHSDRIATIAWNNFRHLELYYGVSGSGLVCHTVNPRLFPEQLIYIMGHAEDRLVFFDKTFLPLVEGLREHLPKVEGWIMMDSPDGELSSEYPWLEFYEDFIATGDS